MKLELEQPQELKPQPRVERDKLALRPWLYNDDLPYADHDVPRSYDPYDERQYIKGGK